MGTVHMPNIMILAQAVIQIFRCQGSIGLQCVSRKREIIQANIQRISRKVNQVTLSEKGFNSVKYSQKLSHLHHVPKLYAWYHDPSSSSSPDILLTKLLYYTKCQSQKREIIQPTIYIILPKVNQVNYNMATVYMPNIMILAQAVIQIFRWQGSIGLQCVSWKREIIQLNIHRILRNVNQVIYTLDTIWVSNIMILAQALLQILCWQGPLWVKCLSVKRGII